MQAWQVLAALPLLLPVLGVVVTLGVPLLITTMALLGPAIALLMLGSASAWLRVQVKDRTSSVDPGFSRIVRGFQQVFSLKSLRSGSLHAREFLKLSILKESKELVHNSSPLPELAGVENMEQKGFKIETISLPGSSNEGEDEKDEVSFVFFHGGALSLCDSADLLMCQRLLPLISHFSGGTRVKMYSVLYTLENGEEGTWTKVHREITEAYDMIERAVKNENPSAKLAAIMGDSAGGHLSLCLGLQLAHRSEKAHIPGLALISPWLNCFEGERYPSILSRDGFKDDILHNRFLQSSIVNYWAGANLDQASFELRTQSELSLPASCVNPWLTDKTAIQKIPSILCLAGSKEVLFDEIREFWDKNIDSSALKTTPGTHKQATKVQFADSDGMADAYDQSRREGLKVTTAKSPQRVNGATRRGIGGATGVRELHITEGEVHAFPLFWRHPLRRVLGPFGLNALFELVYPPPKAELIVSSSTPGTPGGDSAGTPATPSSDVGNTWRDVATPHPKSPRLKDGSPTSTVVGLLPSMSESTIDSRTADAAIERLAHFVAAEHAALNL